MINIFNQDTLDLNNIICHSGGAVGSDFFFETIGAEFGIKTKAYSYKTPNHKSKNKVEISDNDFKEGINEINKANKWLNRYGISKYINLLARNWAQVKYSSQIFAVGVIISPGKKSKKGYYNRSKFEVVDGGTGYCIQMGINNFREIFVFDQIKDSWFSWSYDCMKFVKMLKDPKITSQNFAGVGTREIESNGIKAIRGLYERTLKND